MSETVVRLGVRVHCQLLGGGGSAPKAIAGEFRVNSDGELADDNEVQRAINAQIGQVVEDWVRIHNVNVATLVVTGGGMRICNGEIEVRGEPPQAVADSIRALRQQEEVRNAERQTLLRALG